MICVNKKNQELCDLYLNMSRHDDKIIGSKKVDYYNAAEFISKCNLKVKLVKFKLCDDLGINYSMSGAINKKAHYRVGGGEISKGTERLDGGIGNCYDRVFNVDNRSVVHIRKTPISKGDNKRLSWVDRVLIEPTAKWLRGK